MPIEKREIYAYALKLANFYSPASSSIGTDVLTESENSKLFIINQRPINLHPPVHLLKHKNPAPGHPHLIRLHFEASAKSQKTRSNVNRQDCIPSSPPPTAFPVGFVSPQFEVCQGLPRYLRIKINKRDARQAAQFRRWYALGHDRDDLFPAFFGVTYFLPDGECAG